MSEAAQEEWQPYVYAYGGKRRVVSSRVHCRYHANGRQFSPRIWRGIYIVGKVLTSFLFRALEDFIYVFIRPFLPGRYGQCGTPVGEVIHRGALFCWFLVLIIIGLPLALFGTILRVLAVMMGKKDFTFVRPRTATRVPSLQDEEDVTITLRTQNIGFLPTVSPANGLATPMKRVRALLADLRSGLDDVVCLQEEFDLDVCDYLLSHLRYDPDPASGDLSMMDDAEVETASLPQNKACISSTTSPLGKYGWMIMDVDGKAYRLNSGLFVASRYPLEAPEFVRYHVCTNEDVLAGKGVLACTVVVGETSTGQKVKITVFTTHAQAGRQRRAARVRAIQYEMVMHFIDHYNRKHITSNDILISSIFMGDFNFSPIMPRPSPITGKLVTCKEWAPNRALFHKHHFVNNFYEHSRDGEKRARNRELIFQIQNLFHAEGARLLLQRRSATSHSASKEKEMEELSTASASSSDRPLNSSVNHNDKVAETEEDSPVSESSLDSEEEDERDDEEDDEDDEDDEWNESTYGYGRESSNASELGDSLGRAEREEKIWRMDIASLLKVFQVWAEKRAQRKESTMASDDEELSTLVKRELVRQLKVRKKVFVSEDEVNTSDIIPLALQLRAIPRIQDGNPRTRNGHQLTDDVKGKEKADDHENKERKLSKREYAASNTDGDIEMGIMGKKKRQRTDTGTGLWAGAYEPLIPGTILDTRRYAGKFSQRVRFNDIDHVLMKRCIPGKNVAITKGRISIVWEGVNTFSDHYGKRLTLKFNVGKLLAKQKQADTADAEAGASPDSTAATTKENSKKKKHKRRPSSSNA